MALPPLCPIRFTRAICGDFSQAERREWWLANGRGGYAGGTIAGSLTRRYHGLLTAPIPSPPGRRLLPTKTDATGFDRGPPGPRVTNPWNSGPLRPTGPPRIGNLRTD